jgi:hypothetical protein
MAKIFCSGDSKGTPSKTTEWKIQAEEILGQEIREFDGSRGYITCPLSNLHTQKNRPKDTLIYLSDFPHIHCLHQSCYEQLREVNRFLRIQITGTSKVETSFERKNTRGAEDLMKKSRELILKKYADKKKCLQDLGISSRDFINRMFLDDDLIWIGNPEHTGQQWKTHFRTALAWNQSPPLLTWRFICPNPLKPGSFDRTIENVAVYKHLVLESDELTMEETFTMFTAVEDIFVMKLKGVVFSGNKSYHGWFKHPGLEWLRDNKRVLAAMGFDTATMRPAQPVRIPGVIRENGKRQTFLWL